jgi:hypothetical protein
MNMSATITTFPIKDDPKLPKTANNTVEVFHTEYVTAKGKKCASCRGTLAEANAVAGRCEARGWSGITVVRSYVAGFVHM